MNKAVGLRNIKFYDYCLIIGIVAVLFPILIGGVLFSNSYLSDMISNNADEILIVLFLIFFAGIICLGVLNWGMIYHQYYSKHYWWIVLTIFSGFASIIFYFNIMRKKFKHGDFYHSPSSFSDEIWHPKYS